ncbi:Hypothetical_protein [Hexamita inflata]|uniref:Hypothetical_protein n=1 Tax=Hexamita inflata TaxID=28002 RepID=A0AA86P9G0_9EUKA|nr:Hypothetical protein HINF_LOCUS22025 [Hexamita inflata]CAI9940824.1 Hypothetical protein HINF_LOCUS28469 [Hexamita inflata]
MSIEDSYISANTQIGLLSSEVQNCTINLIIIKSSVIISNSTLNSACLGTLFAQIQGPLIIQLTYIFNISVTSINNLVWSISGGLIGDIYAYKTIIIQTKIINSIIQTSGQVSSSINAGGIIGYSFNGSITIKDVQVTNTNMSAFSLSSNAHCGSLTAYTTGENIQIENIQISNIYIIVDSPRQYAGVFFSINGFTEFTANLVCSKGINIINGNIVANCQNVINQSQSGC